MRLRYLFFIQDKYNMTTTQWKNLFYVICAISILTFGFFLGRKTIKEPETKIEIEYLPGETITDTCYIVKPYKVDTPIDTLGIIQQCIKDGIYKELWPTKVVTEYVEVSKEDTTAIMKDWASKRYYAETLFENEYGTCSFNAEVQYNRMKLIGYNYVPITQTVTETKYVTKAFSPFMGLAYLTNPWGEVRNPMVQINGGFYIKEKYGIQAIYQRGFVNKNDYVGFGFNYKF